MIIITVTVDTYRVTCNIAAIFVLDFFFSCLGVAVSEFIVVTSSDELSKFECSVCHSQFSDRSNARRHIKSAHFSQPIPCMYCGKHYKNARCLRDHLRAQHSDMIL